MKSNHASVRVYPRAEEIMRFCLWAQSQREITPARVQDYWGVARSTAYRWIASWNDARGVYANERNAA